ncbi:MAG: hypothetical protein PHY93_14045 [Bacteriovorax sp.]|nr:hypothetical protein [Bacteriovorax sp.]
MEQVSLWNLDIHASEFKKCKYYLFKTLLSFSKLSWGIISLVWKLFFNLLSLLFVEPNLYKEVSPNKKVIINKTVNHFWPRNF